MELSNQLTDFIIDHAIFDKKSNLLFTVTIDNNSQLINELKTWHQSNEKLNFGGLIGIKILNYQQNENNTEFSCSADYFKLDLMKFKYFVKKEREVTEYRREG